MNMSLTTISDAKNKTGWEDEGIAERFNTYMKDGEIHPDAAVNIYLGWPMFMEQIKYHAAVLGKNKLTILDFGCGAGGLCNKLYKDGHTVIGIDKSEPLLNIAKKNSPEGIKYSLKKHVDSGQECAAYKNQVDLITAMHSLEWNEDVEEIFKSLADFLIPGGLIMFAVFPKGHVIESLQIKDLFEDFDSEENPTKGFCNFSGIRIPVFIKDACHYDEIFKKMNFDKVLEYYPQFPKEFFDKYTWTGAKYPEMMILAYRKPLQEQNTTEAKKHKK